MHIEGVEAEKELEANPWGKDLSTDQFYDLVLAATGSERKARQKAKARRAVYIKEGLEPT